MSVQYRVFIVVFAITFSMTTAAEVLVQVEQVSIRNIVQQVDVTGTVTSPRTAVLSTAVAGIVAEIMIDEGQRVETGDILMKLDAELARLALERVRAEVRQRETEVADSRRRFAEAEKVGTARGIPRSEIESRQAEVASDEAALAASQAATREHQARVERHVLKAPFAGVISDRAAELGEWVNPGDDMLGLISTDNLRFDFQVGQDLFSTLAHGTPVDITLDALQGQTLAAHVDTIVPVKNRGSRTFLVRALADSAEESGKLRITPGMSVRGKLGIETGRSSVVVSRDAILRYPDGRITVWVVETHDELPVVKERAVTTGLEFGDFVEIKAGLAADDVAVTRGNETLQENQTVTIVAGD